MRYPIFVALIAFFPIWVLAARAAENSDNVLTYHADAARSGHYVMPGLTWTKAADMRPDEAFEGHVPGNVYAQPLYWRPAGAAHGLVVVATEDNVVVALDAITGKTVWQRRLGKPIPLSEQPCGNIDPLGITGTPVIDERTGDLYFDAFFDQGKGPRHFVFGLSLADGAVLPGWPVDEVEALGALGMTVDPAVQYQRGALTIVGDKLYVPYSGHFGGCGDYHGLVVGLRMDKPGIFAAWRTSGPSGGVWAPGGIAYDGHDLYIATGGALGETEWGGSEAVIRLPPDLIWRQTSQAFFAPSDWSESGDLGGVNPLPLDLPEGGKGSTLVMALGAGREYLLDRSDLGGIGHPLATLRQNGGGPIGSPATYRVGGDLLVAFRVNNKICPGALHTAGVAAVRVTGGQNPAMTQQWCAGLDGEGAPIVTTSDGEADPIVWIVGAEGDNQLHGFRGDDGKELFVSDEIPSSVANLRHFMTILAAAGRLYFAGDGRVLAFSFMH